MSSIDSCLDQPEPMPIIGPSTIAFWSPVGGAGTTTITTLAALSLASRRASDSRILVVDLSASQQAATALGADRETREDGPFLITSITNSRIDIFHGLDWGHMQEPVKTESILSMVDESKYEWVLFDCPSGLGSSAHVGLNLSRYHVVCIPPTATGELALDLLPELLEWLTTNDRHLLLYGLSETGARTPESDLYLRRLRHRLGYNETLHMPYIKQLPHLQAKGVAPLQGDRKLPLRVS